MCARTFCTVAVFPVKSATKCMSFCPFLPGTQIARPLNGTGALFLEKSLGPVDNGSCFPDIKLGSPTMAEPQNDSSLLLRRALIGDKSALAALFDGYRERLCRMIRLRLDRRLSGRVDSSDVLQKALNSMDPDRPRGPDLAALRAPVER